VSFAILTSLIAHKSLKTTYCDYLFIEAFLNAKNKVQEIKIERLRNYRGPKEKTSCFVM